MLIAPLLTFLPHTLAHHDDAVVAQSSDDGFRDAAARRDLCHTRLVGDGVDDVGRGGLSEFLARNDRDGSSRVLQFRISSHASHRHLVQLQVAIEYVGRVLRMLVVVMVFMVLSCHCRAYPQQRQDEIYLFHSVISF